MGKSQQILEICKISFRTSDRQQLQAAEKSRTYQPLCPLWGTESSCWKQEQTEDPLGGKAPLLRTCRQGYAAEGCALQSSVVSDNHPEMKLCSFAQIYLMVFAPCQSHLSILGPECVLDIKQYMSLYSKTYRWCELNHVELVIAHSRKRVFNPKYWRRQLQISSWPKH